MSMASKYPDHECKKCGIMIKEGDTIVKVDAGHFCKNENCPKPPTTETTEAPPARELEPVEFDSKFSNIKNFARDEIQILKHIELEVKEDLGKVPDTKIGMYVKLIYVKHYMQPIGDI